MGYRSNIHMLVHPAELINVLAAIESAELTEYFDVVNMPKDGEKPPTYYLIRSNYDLKWYTGYEDVDKVNSVFLNSEVSCLCRIGEEYGDIEHYPTNSPIIPAFCPTISVDPDVNWAAIEASVFLAKQQRQQPQEQ